MSPLADHNDLDRWITGNYGEDSVPPDPYKPDDIYHAMAIIWFVLDNFNDIEMATKIALEFSHMTDRERVTREMFGFDEA